MLLLRLTNAISLFMKYPVEHQMLTFLPIPMPIRQLRRLASRSRAALSQVSICRRLGYFSPRIRQVCFPIAGQSAEGPRAMSFLFAMATAAMPGDLHTPRKSRHSSVGTSARAALMSSPAGPIPRLPRHGQPPRERWPARPHEAAGEPNAATRRGWESQYVYYICFRVTTPSWWPPRRPSQKRTQC